MLFFQADPRDGVSSGAACSTCCCEAVTMIAGETNLILIDYGPWSVPLGYGVVDGLEFNVETNTDACPSNEQGGFAYPTAQNRLLTTLASTVLAIDLSVGVAPATNDFTYEIVPFGGPSKGTLTKTGEGLYDYTPNGGVTGRDYFSFEVTDAQARTVIRHVEVNIGTNSERRDLARMSLVPFVDPSRGKVNRDQTVQFPIYMPLNCRPCERHKLTVKQPAQDCDCNTYHHFKCFDITCKPCG